METPGFKRTGVNLTNEELAEVVELIAAARSTPVIFARGVDLAARAWDRVHERIASLAKTHGLPDLGAMRYGLDPENGEFLAPL